jgi:benzoyl-CoA reductase/2-hydroxyglutaryl-CoA dehydratase subunit BcrC/BadD/HgdB
MAGNEAHKSKSSKSTETVKLVGGLVRWCYARAWEAKQREDMNVAWCMMNAPQEILLAMDIVPMFPEQYAAACASKQATDVYCDKAEAEGFSVDTCGFCRTGLGYAFTYMEMDDVPPDAPYGGIPKPDMLIGRSSCDPGYKWFQSLYRWNIPTFIYDDLTPLLEKPLTDKKMAAQYIAYYHEQLKEMVNFLERVTGRKMDWDKFNKVLEISHETQRLAYEINMLRKAVPSPMATEDHMATVFPFWILSGTEQALEFGRKLYDEVRYRVDNNISAIANEKYRLLWMGVAPYHQMDIYNYFESLGAVFAIESEYMPFAPYDIDPSNPLESFAQKEYWAGRSHVVRPLMGGSKLGDTRIDIPAELLLDLIKDYRINGVVVYSVRSCRVLSIGYLRLKQMLEKHLNVPVMFLEGDMADARNYSEAETKDMIDTFMDIVVAADKT